MYAYKVKCWFISCCKNWWSLYCILCTVSVIPLLALKTALPIELLAELHKSDATLPRTPLTALLTGLLVLTAKEPKNRSNKLKVCSRKHEIFILKSLIFTQKTQNTFLFQFFTYWRYLGLEIGEDEGRCGNLVLQKAEKKRIVCSFKDIRI